MNGLKLIEQAFKLHEVERVPWVPFVGVHGGKLVDVDATAYLQSAENMIARLLNYTSRMAFPWYLTSR